MALNRQRIRRIVNLPAGEIKMKRDDVTVLLSYLAIVLSLIGLAISLLGRFVK